MALNCKTPAWQERRRGVLRLEHSAARTSISCNVCAVAPHRAGSAGCPQDGDKSSWLYSGHSSCRAPATILCQSVVPDFHIPISFVSQGQTGIGALLCQIQEGWHRCVLLTTAITASGNPGVTAGGTAVTFHRQGHRGWQKNKAWVTL